MAYIVNEVLLVFEGLVESSQTYFCNQHNISAVCELGQTSKSQAVSWRFLRISGTFRARRPAVALLLTMFYLCQFPLAVSYCTVSERFSSTSVLATFRLPAACWFALVSLWRNSFVVSACKTTLSANFEGKAHHSAHRTNHFRVCTCTSTVSL